MIPFLCNNSALGKILKISLLLNGEKIPVTTEKYSTMTVELLKSFVDEKKYYKQFFNDLIEKDNSKFSFIIEDELGRKEYFDYKKLDIISAFEWAKDNDKLKNEEIEKFKLLKMSSELSAFLDKYKGEKRSINIDGKFVTLPVISFINLLSMEEEEIAKVISKEEFNDLSLNEFVFALDNFLDETKILERFKLPNTYLNNLSKLKEIVDITYINRCIDNDNTYLKKVQVSENFKQELLSDIPSHFDKLEKAYYIYYRMCYLLTYDGEQFARRENKDYEIAHHDFDRIKTIDSRNNKIVCYEFNAIYANMLRELGINYELNGDRMYSLGHASLTFSVDNYLVNADSTVGLIKSDLSYAKNGMKLLGFTLESENSKTKEEFYRKIETVNKFIKMQNDKKYFGTVRELNKFAYSIPSDLDLETKTALFITMSNNSNLPIVDKIPYQIELKNKKVGIVGLGNIGTRVAEICEGIGMNIYYWNRTKKHNRWNSISIDKLFKECDVIFICLSINEETKKLITDNLLYSIKKTCILISGTGKQLFHSDIVENKIKNHELFGYALEEPDTELDKYHGNIMVTSEYGWFTKEASDLRMKKWFELIINYLAKE